MTKRKSVAGVSEMSGAKRSGDSSEEGQTREGKRHKRSTSPSIDPAEVCNELYDTIRTYKDKEGRLLCEPFIRVPKRRGSPDYYEVVDSPIDLLKIQQRLKTDEYEDVETFSRDMELLLDNAAKYYKPDSQERKDALLLKDVFLEAKERLCAEEDEDDPEDSEKMEGDGRGADWSKGGNYSGEDEDLEKNKSKSASKTGTRQPKRPLLPADDDDNESTSTRDGDENEGSSNMAFMEVLVSAVLEMRDSHGRLVCELFKRLPPPTLYPEYYAVIKEPIDLKMICTQLRASHYSSLDDLEKDLQLMVKNAHTFNEPGSQVYKDASAIKKMIQTKRAEIEHTLMGAKSSKRLKARRSVGVQSTAIDALLEESDYVFGDGDAEIGDDLGDEGSYDDDDDFGGAEDLSNPLVELFNEIYTRTDPTGRPLVEPFLRLPSRRAYPDYYEVIKNPIALSKIRSQIKAGHYESLDSLEKDLQLCFQNAQTYNEPNSMLYLDAQRLEEQMRRKKAEIVRVMAEKGITLEDFKMKKKAKKLDSPAVPTTVSEVDMKKKKLKPELPEKPKKVRKGEEMDPVLLKKRMRQMFKAVASYQDENGRYLSAIFMELPSAQDYPDYYKVISEPVCLNQIERNIRDQKYSHEDEMILDFEVMFDNAKYYNEEDSQVHQDACTLSKVLMKKKKALGLLHPVSSSDSGPQQTPTKQMTPTKSGRISSPSSSKKYSQVPSATSELKELYKDLFTAIKDCTDGSGRQLCVIFQKLPSRNDYPDYYSLIKRPIDMAKISAKLHGEQYQTLEDFLSDFILMFDNACRYNDPDSQVYKDALTLQRELLRKKSELVADESKVPHVPSVVRKLLSTLYHSVMQHVDDEGRCFSDSLAQFYISPDDAGHRRKISLSTIGEDLRKGYYRRLDQLQDDFVSILEKAREVCRSDNEMYDDAVELEQYFVAERDKLCKEGERFISPALLTVTRRHLQQELDEERKSKAEADSREDAQLTEAGSREGTAPEPIIKEACVAELSCQGAQYRVGEYVYFQPRAESEEPNVVLIEKLWTSSGGEQCLFGTWFYNVERTHHIPSRKFLENEIFKSTYSAPVKLSQAGAKCVVMHIKNHVKQIPEGFSSKDVFVCESSYNMKRRTFKKLKSGPMLPSNVTLIPRGELLSPARTQRAAVRMQPKDTADTVGRTGAEDAGKKNTVNVMLESPLNPEEGCTYFEQFCVRGAPYKIGDCVYVRTDEDFYNIARIDKIWTDRSGFCWFHGPWFVSAADIQHLPTRMFHEKEVFLSSLEESTPIMNVNGKCCVLAFREYCRCRPTEIPEKDVYLNEARYDEEEGQFRKLKGLKRFTLTLNVQEDEYFFFEEAITPSKVPSPLLMDEHDFVREEHGLSPTSSADVTGETGTGKKHKKQKTQSGYLIFSHEMRNIVRKDHPEYGFGEISRIVGVEWRNLSAAKKAEYEARAQMQLGQATPESGADSHPSLTGPVYVYCCLWRGCDHQYEDLQDLKIHVLDNTGHMQKSEDGIFRCLWTTCMRPGRGLRPFNASSKLFRHCREVHLVGPPRQILPHERSKNFFPRHQAVLYVPSPEPSPSAQPQVSSVATNLQGNVVGAMPGTPQASGAASTGMQANQAAYLGGRLTPQSLQQAMYPGSGAPAGYGGQAVTQNLNPAAQIMQRQMSMGSPGPNMGPAQPQATPMPGQVTPYQPVQPQPQQFSQTQPSHFNFQQPIGQVPQLQQQAAPSPPPQMPQQYQQPTTPVPAQPAALPHREAVQPAPVFVAPPSKPQRLQHSDAYLRYIEGLRDGRAHMSQWGQARKPLVTPQLMAQLPTHWLGSGYGNYDNAVDALWALREHMLKDSLSLARQEGC